MVMASKYTIIGHIKGGDGSFLRSWCYDKYAEYYNDQTTKYLLHDRRPKDLGFCGSQLEMNFDTDTGKVTIKYLDPPVEGKFLYATSDRKYVTPHGNNPQDMVFDFIHLKNTTYGGIYQFGFQNEALVMNDEFAHYICWDWQEAKYVRISSAPTNQGQKFYVFLRERGQCWFPKDEDPKVM